MKKLGNIFRVLPFLLLSQTPGIGQSQDFMPLALGNRWRYEYFAYNDELLVEWRTWDTGTATIRIVGRSVTPDSILWDFEETRDILHRYNFYFPPIVDTTYAIKDTIRYSVIEYLDGNHRFYRKGWWNWLSVFLLSSDFSDSSAFFRFQPQVVGDTLAIRVQSPPYVPVPKSVLEAVFTRGAGLTSVRYEEPYMTGTILYTNHNLQDAVVTSVAQPWTHSSPDRISLLQNHPNPFNPSTTITYELPNSAMVNLSVYDLLGREVSVLVDEKRRAGVHEVKFDGTGLSSGVYFYRLTAGSYVQTRKLVLMK